MELADGVHALELTVEHHDREITIHPAAVETDRGVVLLDAGWPGQGDAIDDALSEAGLADDVWAVVATHQDGDHCGSLREVVDRTDAVVFAHREATPYIDGREQPIKGGDDRYPPVPVDVEVADGVTFRTDAGEMQVAYTPGHTPGHCALYFPDERLLVAADALTADEEGLQGPNEEMTPDMDMAARSVAALANLDVESVLCYHGGYVEDGSERIGEIAEELGG